MAGTRPVLTLSTLVLVGLLLAPIAVVGWQALTPSGEAWGQLWAGPLPDMLVTTGGLLLAVAAGTLVLGAGLAWLVTAYDFPGVGFFSWALVLPLAMPAYILGFVFLAIFDFPGPVQTALRTVFGPDAWFPDVRSLPGAALVLSLTLYPYIFVLARAALREQVPATFESARLLGDSRLRAARRVVLPIARPALAAGSAIVMMEVLTDFATVQYFGVDTVSVGVYQVWRGMFDREVAIELAGLVLLVALVVIAAERMMRGSVRYFTRGTARDFERGRLEGRKAAAATVVCGGVLGAAVVLPVVQLGVWAMQAEARVDAGRAFEYLGNSLGVALAAGLACVVLALIIAGGARLSGSWLARRAAQLATAGYAVPGPVVALGVLALIIGAADLLGASPGRLAVLSLTGLVYAYVIRFMAVAYGSVDASLESITPNVVGAAHTLGSGPAKVLRNVHLPLARAGALAGFVLVLVDVLKELPIVLLVRPFGFSTASIWVWQLASESRWQSAAIPALLIVAAAIVPVAYYLRRGREDPSGLWPYAPTTAVEDDERAESPISRTESAP